MRGDIKVFKLDDRTWWAGADLESCITDAMEELGLERDEVADPDARELSDNEMNTFRFIDGDDPVNADGSRGGTMSFRDALAQNIARGDSFPQFFASTEY